EHRTQEVPYLLLHLFLLLRGSLGRLFSRPFGGGAGTNERLGLNGEIVFQVRQLRPYLNAFGNQAQGPPDRRQVCRIMHWPRRSLRSELTTQRRRDRRHSGGQVMPVRGYAKQPHSRV